MSRGRILFRADASHALGFGHVARVCALVEEAAAHGLEPHVLLAGDVSALKAWARDRKLAADVRDWSATQIVQAAEHPQVRAVVVDGPALALELVPKLPPHIRAVIVDDRGRCPLSVSSVINHNVHASELAATYPFAQQRLLGRRYLMLRRDIRRYMRGSCRPDHSGSRLRLLVTFGGSDPVGATARIVRLLPPDRPLDVVVIAGPGFRDDHALREAIITAKQLGHDVDVRRAPDDPGALFVSADAAISSAGGTLGELAYLGCPALAYAIVPDQTLPARHQVRNGLVAGGRRLDDATDDVVRGDLLAFVLDDPGRLEQRKRALATADSEGPRRIVEEAIAP